MFIGRIHQCLLPPASVEVLDLVWECGCGQRWACKRDEYREPIGYDPDLYGPWKTNRRRFTAPQWARYDGRVDT